MARPKLGEGDTQRLQLKISEEELTAIDDWRFANRVPSRSEAVRRLCQIGLIANQDRSARFAFNVMAHLVPPDGRSKVESLLSGLSFEDDVKRLCMSVITDRGKILAFEKDTIDSAMKDAHRMIELLEDIGEWDRSNDWEVPIK